MQVSASPLQKREHFAASSCTNSVERDHGPKQIVIGVILFKTCVYGSYSGTVRGMTGENNKLLATWRLVPRGSVLAISMPERNTVRDGNRRPVFYEIMTPESVGKKHVHKQDLLSILLAQRTEMPAS